MRRIELRGLAWFAIISAFLSAGRFPAAPSQQEAKPPPAFAHFTLLQTLKTPGQPIWGLGFGGAHDTLVGLGNDGQVRWWDAATGTLLRTIPLAEHPKTVTCMAVSPDGRWIAVGESFLKASLFTAKVELIDGQAGRDVRTLATHHWEVESLAFRRDGRWLVSSNWDRKVRVMELPGGDVVRELESPAKPHCAAISPDGTMIATCGDDAAIVLWDGKSGKVLGRLTGHREAIYGASFSPDGKRLASAGLDGTARLWDVPAGKCIFTLSGHKGRVFAVAFSPDGRLVATGGADRTVRLWDVSTGRSLEALGGLSSVWKVAFSTDGRYLAAGYVDGTINVWKRRD